MLPGVTGGGENVQLVVQHYARLVAGQRQDEALVEPVDHVLVGLGPVPAVDVHGHGEELFQRGHSFEKNENGAATLNSLDWASQQIRGQGFKVLQHTHAKGLT